MNASSRTSDRTPRGRAPLLALAALAVTASLAGSAQAQDFAAPPRTARRAVVADPGEYAPPIEEERQERYHVPRDYGPRPSLVHLYVGPAGKLAEDGASPGLLAALDIGRGPAGLRLTGAWMDVGDQEGLSQYTGELTIDFGGRSAVRPVIGAGGGVARTSSSVNDDGTRDLEHGATLGVGIVRAGVGVRLPFEDADARVAFDATGTLAAIRSARAPSMSPWLVTSISVGIGF